MNDDTAMQVNGWVWLIIGYLLGLGMAVLIDHLNAPSISLKESEWRCAEYLPGAADCALYQRVVRPHE